MPRLSFRISRYRSWAESDRLKVFSLLKIRSWLRVRRVFIIGSTFNWGLSLGYLIWKCASIFAYVSTHQIVILDRITARSPLQRPLRANSHQFGAICGRSRPRLAPTGTLSQPQPSRLVSVHHLHASARQLGAPLVTTYFFCIFSAKLSGKTRGRSVSFLSLFRDLLARSTAAKTKLETGFLFTP